MKRPAKSGTLSGFESTGRVRTACSRLLLEGVTAIEEKRLNATTELKKSPSGASDMAHIVLTFDNNRLASALYGQFDENLARIEQKLGVDIRSRGNQLTIKGTATAAEQARRALDHLYGILQKGVEIGQSDVDGAVRMAVAADDQLTLPTLE